MACAFAVACDAPAPSEPQALPAFDQAAEFQEVSFVLGPLSNHFGAIELLPNGSRHFRDGTLSGAVSGDLTGTFVANGEILFSPTFTGNGHGKATISGAEGDWTGDVVMKFDGIFMSNLNRYVPLGWFQLTLQGPENNHLFATCQERMPPTSETLDCTGIVLVP